MQVALIAGEAHDNRLAGKPLSRLKAGTTLAGSMTPMGSETLPPREAFGPTACRYRYDPSFAASYLAFVKLLGCPLHDHIVSSYEEELASLNNKIAKMGGLAEKMVAWRSATDASREILLSTRTLSMRLSTISSNK